MGLLTDRLERKHSEKRMSLLRKIIAVMRKDVIIELRTKEMFSSMLVFSLIAVFIFSVALDLAAANPIDTTPGLLWVTIAFAGTLEGPKIKGRIEGVDYLLVRADGRPQINLQASITTDDGEKIAVEEDGILFPDPDAGPSMAQLRLNMRLTTASAKYNWVNFLHIWLHGCVDMVKGEVQVKAYAA